MPEVNGPEELHLDAEQLAGYLDRALDARERIVVEAHLAECSECREELVEVARLVRGDRRRRRAWFAGAGAVAAAAAAVALFIALPISNGTTSDESVLRNREAGARTEGVPVFQTVAPGTGESVGRESIVFVWRSAGPQAQYRLTLSMPDGQIVWSTATADTVVSVPGSVTLEAGRDYFWYVDALLTDGGTARSAVNQFTAQR